jgi:hypothetical protein
LTVPFPGEAPIYFRFDRRLLADLAHAAASAITDVVRVVSDRPEGAPGIILALKTFNQDLTLNPHLYVLATEGLLCSDDTFLPAPTIDALLLEHAFRRRVFNPLLPHQKIAPALVDAMHRCKHSGFSAHTAVDMFASYLRKPASLRPVSAISNSLLNSSLRLLSSGMLSLALYRCLYAAMDCGLLAMIFLAIA